MGEIIKNFLKRKKVVLAGAALAIGMAATGMVMLTQPQAAAAAPSCQTQDQYPDTNILYCGLSGGNNASQVISSFQSQYKNNTDGHGHTDIQVAYNDTGATSAMVNGMNTSNTKLGTAYKNGTIVVNGRTIATNAWIGARWTQGGSAYKHIEGDVYTRSASTYFLPNASQVTVIVHFNNAGVADFAAMEPCGNMITFTATPPPPAPKSISCVSLTAQPGAATPTSIDYTFVAKATAQNVTITDYVFNFGDNSMQTVPTNTTTATTQPPHTYTLTSVSKTVTATVVVNGGGLSNTCTVHITLTPTTPKPSQQLSCLSLSASPQGTDNRTYIFTAVAKPDNTTITSYTFYFGDGTSKTIDTSASTAITEAYTYASSGPYNASVSVTGPLGTFSNDKTCVAPITPASTPTPPTTPPTTPTPPTTLVNTGAGSVIGIFGATSVAGAFFYNFVVRRKLLARS